MLFTSLVFALFFVVTFVAYYFPLFRKHQVVVLVVASLVFYSWNDPALLVLLAISILINALTSYKVSRSDPQRAWRYAVIGVVSNLLILALFKYGGLLTRFVVNIAGLPETDPIVALMHLPLPIGISFYTFEGISLLVDTIRLRKQNGGEVPFVSKSLAHHISHTALFVAFFPHLVSGPILKARHFYPQIGEKLFRDINWEAALRCLVLGYFLKTVVADNIKDYTAWISFPYYETLSLKTGLVLLYGYSIQIFADFAGYSLIAIGLGFLFGYQLPPNFNYPYISRSIAEFWRRWHISLSTWLRDYLYIPLGGNRKGELRTYLNLAAVMVLGGLWHGAAWSYAVWGAYHGVGLAAERLVANKFRIVETDEPRGGFFEVVWGTVRILLVFGFVTFGWLFFKLPNFSDVIGFIQALITNASGPFNIKTAPVIVFSMPVILLHVWNTGWVVEWRRRQAEVSGRVPRLVEATAIAVFVFAIFSSGGSGGEFIYFQF